MRNMHLIKDGVQSLPAHLFSGEDVSFLFSDQSDARLKMLAN